MWLEITGKCQLRCTHCYAESGPQGTNGLMVKADWENVIDQVAGLGAAMVQFIGGEPTLHRDLPALVRHARSRGLQVEVFTQPRTHLAAALGRVRAAWRTTRDELLQRPCRRARAHHQGPR
ncbi:radical SAM protein [Saccharothrix australiensis]|uniref:radical SAM protein n=1 Tax=Saccharothrix australiensis TaxID=2072 RepID=UPI001FEB4D9A|nr:radical SAM protein [Saccharothrix australiensis]